jgi:ABC-type sugar transport system ATPase subunit
MLGFRPEAAEITSEGGLTGNVYATDMHGAYTMLHINLNENEIIHIRGDRAISFPIGTQVRFDLKPDMVRFFHPKTEKAIREEAHS